MKTLAIAFAVAAIATPLAAQPASVDISKIAAGTYKADGSHTQVAFTVNHMGFTDYRGLIADAKGELTLDPKNPAAASVTIEIPISNLATTSAGLTKHLHAADFFDSAKYPTATFRSTKVVVDGQTAKITGDLTLRGVTKPVTLDARLTGAGPNPMSKAQTVGFHASAVIKRSDFGMTYIVPVVSDAVDLQIEAAFEKVN
ncbi:YceI family protein [Phenylobacterium sp. Root700]|uniref:YceI family protein n=1 Tax=Phenylobacterium sp. Root700 TaxID=1736591 RepID=UPI00070055CB|nr:YceI family protein [Phenylobacterium sp. Root700]KRB42536.1 hypothetical protein ASE02_21665 [Phenylobacterium sp. Root700]